MPQRILLYSGLCLFFLLSSACLQKKTISYQDLTTAVARRNQPQRVAVLPFVDRTDNEALSDLVRISLYSHLSAKPYQDIELYQIDQRLGSAPASDPSGMSTEQIVALGRRLGADALVFGEVTRFDRIFIGIYSQLCIAANIAIYDTKTGQPIWQDAHTTRFHGGGLPFNLLEIPIISLRSGLNLTETSKIQAVDDLTRNLVSRIPFPDADRYNPGQRYEVQAGSFLNESHAAELIQKLRDAGLPAFLRSHRSAAQQWFRVLLGPYGNRAEAVGVREKIRKATGAKAFIASITPAPGE